jgi:soluble lytic murein transglycosylase
MNIFSPGAAFNHSSITSEGQVNNQAASQASTLEAAAEQFEALFLQQVLKQMRKAGDVLAADSPMRSRELDTMRDFYDGMLADTLATKRQTGIADLLVKQLSGANQSEPSQDAATEMARNAAIPERSLESAVSMSALRSTWQRSVDGLANVWNSSSAGFKSLVQSVIKQESAGQVDAISPKGALGIMQLMPDTARDMAKELGISFNLGRLTRDADYNQQLGSAYLSRLLQRYDGEQALAVAAYNAGPARVDEWLQRHGDPRLGEVSVSAWVRQIPFKETREYTSKVLADVGKGVVSPLVQSPAQEPFKPAPVSVALTEGGVSASDSLLNGGLLSDSLSTQPTSLRWSNKAAPQ